MGLYIWRKEDYQEIEKSKCRVSEATEFLICLRISKEATMIGEKKARGKQKGTKRKTSKRYSQKGKWEEE